MTKFDPYPYDGNAKRSSSRRWWQRDGRHVLAVGTIFAAGLAVGAWALTVTSRDASNPATARYDAAGVDDRTGNILDTRSSRCRSFDNDTGRMVETGPCDPNGKRPLTGTAQRLDAISKSFFGR
jgi:hypothetical protein